MLPVLYSFRRCPYAIRARLALEVAGVALELREVLLKDKPAALRAVSPKATVPVLVLPDGRVLDESLDIMRWALGRQDPEGWLAQGDTALGQRLIAVNDGPFKAALDAYKYPERHPQATQHEHRGRAVALQIAALEALLADRPCLVGPAPALADMAVMPFVRQFAQIDAAWFAADHPRLQTWLDRLTGTPLFASVMARQPVWLDAARP